MEKSPEPEPEPEPELELEEPEPAIPSPLKVGVPEHAASPTGSQVGRVTVVLNNTTGLREANIDTFLGSTAVNVGNKHRREARGALLDEGASSDRLGGGATRDSNRSTVHVHFTAVDAVKLGPGKSVLAGSDTVWDSEVEVIWIRSASVEPNVAVSIRRAASLDGLDNLPSRQLSRGPIFS